MILIIEDEEPLARVYQRALQTNGFPDVQYTCIGGEGLSLIERKNPALVIVDVALTDMNGVQLAQKAISRGYTGPFVLVSGAIDSNPQWIRDLALPELPLPSFELQLQKPLEIRELLDLVSIYVPREAILAEPVKKDC